MNKPDRQLLQETPQDLRHIGIPAHTHARLNAIFNRPKVRETAPDAPKLVSMCLQSFRDLIEVHRLSGKGFALLIEDKNGKIWPYPLRAAVKYPGTQEEAFTADGGNLVLSISGHIHSTKKVRENMTYIFNNTKFNTVRSAVVATVDCVDEVFRIQAVGDSLKVKDDQGRMIPYTPRLALNWNSYIHGAANKLGPRPV